MESSSTRSSTTTTTTADPKDVLKECQVCATKAADAPQRKLLRCSRCQQVSYCSKDCQKQHWKYGGHKRECRPAPKPLSKDQLFRKRYKELRQREKLSVKDAMEQAREEFGLTNDDGPSAGSQVAAMFGLSNV